MRAHDCSSLSSTTSDNNISIKLKKTKINTIKTKLISLSMVKIIEK